MNPKFTKLLSSSYSHVSEKGVIIFVNRSVVYMTDLAHFTHTRGLRVVGLADIIVRHVPAVKYRMDVRKLKQLIMEDQKVHIVQKNIASL